MLQRSTQSTIIRDKYNHISYCCRIVDCGLTVDRQKIETNIAHCSLALTDFNNHFIFTVVDEKN